jgi:hypothetical protein
MPYGRYRNPYSSLGNSAADIVSTFINKKGIQQGGYLDASKSMADIDSTRAGTDKIMQELAGNDRANSLTREDYNAAKGGDYGAQMELAQRRGQDPGGMETIMGLLSDPSMMENIQNMIPQENRPAAWNAVSQDENDINGMLDAVLKDQSRNRNAKGKGEAIPDLNDPAAILKYFEKGGDISTFLDVVLNQQGTTGQGVAAVNQSKNDMSDTDILNLLYPDGLYDAEQIAGAPARVKAFKEQWGQGKSGGKAQFDYVPGNSSGARLVPTQ